MDHSSIENLLTQTARDVGAALAAALDRHDADCETLWDAMRYSALAPGKRVRPFLVLETAKILGGERQAALPLALAAECLHVSSLIHDDLPCMDDDTLRRGLPTCHVQFGEAAAVLAGDALLTLAFELAASAPIPAALTAEAVAAMAACAGAAGMMGGQMIDLQSGDNPAMPLDALRKLQTLKTGRLLRLSVTLGCLAAGKSRTAHPALFAAAEAYADNLGTAFQIVDDILDVTGDAGATGKSTGQDAKNDRVTFVTALGLAGAQAEADRLTQQSQDAAAALGDAGTLQALAGWLRHRTH